MSLATHSLKRLCRPPEPFDSSMTMAAAKGLAGWSGGRVSLERQVQRRRPEHHQESERTPSGGVGRREARVLTRGEHDVVCLPEERVVRLDSVRPGGNLFRDGLTEAQDGELIAVE